MSSEGNHIVEVISSGFPETRAAHDGFGPENEGKRFGEDETNLPPDKEPLLNKSAAKDAKLWASVASACAYALVGLLVGFFNKAVLQGWPYPNSFLTMQIAVTIAVVYSMQAWGLITVKPLQRNAIKNLLPVVFFYNSNVAFALVAVNALSIPVYHVLKRLTPVMVLASRYLIWGHSPSTEVTLSVLVVVSGCLMAGIGDLSFDLGGYSAALMSCALQSTYLILVERSGNEKGFSSMELLLYNGILSLPVLLTIILTTGEIWKAMEGMQAQCAQNVWFLPLLISSLLMGSLLNYCLFLCTLCNSALTTTIVGTLRSVLATVAGFFVFGGVKGTPSILLGVTTNTVGGVWYTMIKYKEKQVKTPYRTVKLETSFKRG